MTSQSSANPASTSQPSADQASAEFSMTSPSSGSQPEVSLPQGISAQHSDFGSSSLSEDELLDTVMQASDLEQGGQLDEAIALYNMLIVADPDGQYGAMARKALEGISEPSTVTTPSPLLGPVALTQSVEEEGVGRFTEREPQPAQPAGIAPESHSVTILSGEQPSSGQTISVSSPRDRTEGDSFKALPPRVSFRKRLLTGLLTTEVIAWVGLLGGGALMVGEIYRADRSATAPLEQSSISSSVEPTSAPVASPGLTSAIVRGLAPALGVMLLALVVRTLLVLKLTQTLTHPVAKLQELAEDFSRGHLDARAEFDSNDEFEQLAQTLNEMAINLSQGFQAQVRQVEQTRQEAQQQQQKAETLQQRVMALLIEIDGAREGNLTVRAQVSDDEMGSIADAFNLTISSLQELVLQTQQIATHVSESAASSEQSVSELAQSATLQSEAMAEALRSVEDVSQSIKVVATTASEGAQISQRASVAANQGGEAMEQTVSSIGELRSSVAETSKKVKRLAESSQEISRIVALISEISSKTNLLAFNASVEAVRAGEHGQGFRVVADEVRRLAEQVTYATQEIEQLVTGIQLETAEVLTMMEKGTEQVVTGSQLVNQTRTTLSSLVETHQQIDELLQTISSRTTSQTQVSQAMSEAMKAVAAIAQKNKTESAEVTQTLQLLVGFSQALQHSVAQFRA